MIKQRTLKNIIRATGVGLHSGEKVYLTSSTLFSRKLEHIKGNPKVSVSITDPIAVGGRTDRATIQATKFGARLPVPTPVNRNTISA